LGCLSVSPVGVVVAISVAPGQEGSQADGAVAPVPGVVRADGQHATAADEVGLVAGTEDSTPLQFAVALDEASYLQLDDVVVTVRDLPGGGHVATSGIVTQVRARHA